MATWLALLDETIIDIVYRWATRHWHNDDTGAAAQEDDNSHDRMPNLMHTCVAGKGTPTPRLHDIRIVVLQPALLAIIDILIAVTHNEVTIRKWPGPEPERVYTAAGPGTQALDITYGITLLLERRADEAGRSAIAVADIKQFYDNVGVGHTGGGDARQHNSPGDHSAPNVDESWGTVRGINRRRSAQGVGEFNGFPDRGSARPDSGGRLHRAEAGAACRLQPRRRQMPQHVRLCT